MEGNVFTLCSYSKTSIYTPLPHTLILFSIIFVLSNLFDALAHLLASYWI